MAYHIHVSDSANSKCTFQIPCLLDATSDSLVSGLERGCFTSVDLVNAYIRRIAEVNLVLRVVMELNPDASAIAAVLDAERAQGQLRGPLHGLPVLLKGNVGTRDPGSYALQDAVLPADSTIAAKLREQGFIILGKASLTEWSMFRSNNSSHGWNAVFGQSYGAYYPRQCPGGSSGGSAVASDLGLAWATLGTETSGSIVIPSGRNNVVGIKPTVGLTSRYLIVPVSEHQDTVGPIARTVKDAAKLLQAIAGLDPNDRYTYATPFKDRCPDYLAACKLSGLQGKRIGVARNVINESSNGARFIKEAFDRALSIIVDAGAIIVEDTNFTAFSKWKQREYNPVTRADFVSNLKQYLNMLEHNPRGIHSIEDLRRFTRKFPQEEYPSRNTRNWDTAIEQKINNTCTAFGPLYQENLFLGGEGGILGALECHRLDAVVLPTEIAPEIPAMVGTPIITVPLCAAPDDSPVEREKYWEVIENAPGIPAGISFLGSKWSEETLIAIAYAFEQRHSVRKVLSRYLVPRTDLADIIAR